MALRWHVEQNRDVELPQAEAFLDEIEAVCRKHGLSISHEDGHGGFEIVPFEEFYLGWLRDAAWREKG